MATPSDPMGSPPPLRRASAALAAVRRVVLTHRRGLAALCLGVAVASGVRAVTAPPPPTVAVPVARHDLPSGTVLAAADLTTARLPDQVVPDGLVTDVVGRTLASPLRRGEPVTDVRLVGAPLARATPGLVATPVRLPDAAAVALLSVGDRIDLFATDPRRGRTSLVADEAIVLALPRAPDEATGPLGGRVILLGLPASSVEKVADAAAQVFLSFAFSA